MKNIRKIKIDGVEYGIIPKVKDGESYLLVDNNGVYIDLEAIKLALGGSQPLPDKIAVIEDTLKRLTKTDENVSVQLDELNKDFSTRFNELAEMKQDSIEDLAIIREGAEKGATALQPSDVDEEISETSRNPVQNRVIALLITELVKFYTQSLEVKVNKVDGKQLSTEDFTTALKTKLQGLSNYDDTEITTALSSLQSQIDTLVSGNASDAINSFNEIIAFLDGIKDSQDLAGIIASIEKQIASKQEKLVSGKHIKTINGQEILGEGNIVIEGGSGGANVPQDLMDVVYPSDMNNDFSDDFAN